MVGAKTHGLFSVDPVVCGGLLPGSSLSFICIQILYRHFRYHREVTKVFIGYGRAAGLCVTPG